MNRKFILFFAVVSLAWILCPVANAQTIERVSFQSVAGGNDRFQPVVGAPFGVSAGASGGSLTITSEYGEEVFHDEMPQSVEDGRVPIAEGISLYPNPADYVVNILVDNAVELGSDATVEVFDMGGRLMLSQRVGEGEVSLDVSALKAGTYLIRIGKATAKMVKR
ncbi:MAG: T9SS type A sorting domain-containing protein [Bacteroidales bacterium]|nr:T9SS type A sorting domain-containing protein [Bacteroidales bacterium]